MEETDDSLDDWTDLMTSPSGLLSGFMSEPCFSKSVSDVLSTGVFMSNPEMNLGEDEIRVGSVVVVDNTMVNSISNFDFNDTSSLCLTIPSGISPNELFGSPVMLPNSQLSPTTGTLDSTPLDHSSPMLRSACFTADKEQDGDDVSSFRLKAPANPVSFQCYPPSHSQRFSTKDDCQSLVAVQQPLADFQFLTQQDNPRSKGLEVESSNIPFNIAMKAEAAAFQISSHSYRVAHNEMRGSVETPRIADAGGGGQSLDGAQKEKGVYPSAVTTKTTEDGYNWRKYGQKQVKGSDFPRSYFKCTHTSCLVKKKVERSHDGDITEIIYKGAHNHPKPQPSSRRSTFGSAVPCGESTDIGEGSGSYLKADPVWREMQQHGFKDARVGSEWRSEGLDIASSTSVITEVSSDPHSSNPKPVGALDSVQTPELSSTLASHDEEEEDDITQGSLSVGEDDDVETESKRRKKESCMIETAIGSRAHREPRVIVQIESEVDIIDDGYRWRKYGQKVVKGNPNPRSYYKCTSAGCTVRKHVERASHNLKYVLTTYEGKHNHLVPAARNSGSGNLPPSSTSQSSLTLPRNPHLPKSEPQDFVPPFDRKMEYETEFLRPNYLGNFSGASSLYQHLKLPSIPGSGLYGAFGLNPNYTSSAPPIIPTVRDLSIPLPITFPLPSSLAMASYNNQGRPFNPVPPIYMDQQLKESDIKLLRPKQEH